MIEIQSPDKIKTDKYSIFLAGSIDMGKADDWQKETCKELEEFDIYLYNPRRNDWDSSWKQEIGNKQFYEQVTWELDGLEKADMIIVNFSKDSKAPITFFELGAHLKDNIYLCCPEGFYRKGNIDIYVEYYGLKNYFNTFEDLIKGVKKEIDNKLVEENKMKHTFNENYQSFVNVAASKLGTPEGKRQIKEFVRLIGGDKILTEQMNLFSIVTNGLETKEINEVTKSLMVNTISWFKTNYTKDSIHKANKKLDEFMVENKIPISHTNSTVEDALTKLLENGNDIKSINENIKYTNIILENIKPLTKHENDMELMENVKSFDISALSEDDQRILNKLILANNKEKKENLFNEIREECVSKVNKLYSESMDIDEKERLLNHKENLLNKKMNEETFDREFSNLMNYKKILNNV